MDNVGLFMHKLTKYQTLYAHGTDADKKKVYGQKINYYTEKLTNMGMSKSNLAELGRLTGGAVTDDITVNIKKAVETLRKKLEESSKSQEQKQKEVSDKVVKASDELEKVKTNYLDIVDNVVNMVITVKTQLDILATEVEGVKDVATTGIPKTVDKLIKNAEILLKLVTQDNFNKSLNRKINDEKKKFEQGMEPDQQARMKEELDNEPENMTDEEPENMTDEERGKFLSPGSRN